MHNKVLNLVRAAIIATLYALLTHYQNLLFPGSTTWAVQCRLSEALCILAFFTPAAIPGLSVGCLIFNLYYAAALPIDWIVGTLATLLSVSAMRALRHVKIRSLPLAGLLMPALFNGLLVGAELTYYFGGGFLLNAFYVALGELIVLLPLGSLLYYTIRRRKLDAILFK